MTRAVKTCPTTDPKHWSQQLPRGHGRSVYADIWLIPATVTAAGVTGAVLRWWLR
jgi:hypothetical protein